MTGAELLLGVVASVVASVITSVGKLTGAEKGRAALEKLNIDVGNHENKVKQVVESCIKRFHEDERFSKRNISEWLKDVHFTEELAIAIIEMRQPRLRTH